MKQAIFRTLLCSLLLLGAWLCVQPNAAQAVVVDYGAEPVPGQWWNPNHVGNNFDFQRNLNDEYTLTWYTFRTNGTPIWYISDTNAVVYGRWVSTLYRSHWSSVTKSNELVNIGTVRLDFTSDTDALFTWDFNSAAGFSTGVDGSANVTLSMGGGTYTGLWYETALPGWGISVIDPAGLGGSLVTVSFYDGYLPTWAQTFVDTAPTGFDPLVLTRHTRTGACPGCTGPVSNSQSNIGFVYLNLGTWSGTAATYITLPSYNTWHRGHPYFGGVNMQRLTFP